MGCGTGTTPLGHTKGYDAYIKQSLHEVPSRLLKAFWRWGETSEWNVRTRMGNLGSTENHGAIISLGVNQHSFTNYIWRSHELSHTQCYRYFAEFFRFIPTYSAIQADCKCLCTKHSLTQFQALAHCPASIYLLRFSSLLLSSLLITYIQNPLPSKPL